MPLIVQGARHVSLISKIVAIENGMVTIHWSCLVEGQERSSGTKILAVGDALSQDYKMNFSEGATSFDKTVLLINKLRNQGLDEG